MAYATKIKVWQLSTVLLAAALVMVSLFARRAQAVPQPNMEAALGHLEQAKASLERGEHNKGGFRSKALEATTTAIGFVREGIQTGNH
jgi:hypothetical protein